MNIMNQYSTKNKPSLAHREQLGLMGEALCFMYKHQRLEITRHKYINMFLACKTWRWCVNDWSQLFTATLCFFNSNICLFHRYYFINSAVHTAFSRLVVSIKVTETDWGSVSIHLWSTSGSKSIRGEPADWLGQGHLSEQGRNKLEENQQNYNGWILGGGGRCYIIIVFGQFYTQVTSCINPQSEQVV